MAAIPRLFEALSRPSFLQRHVLLFEGLRPDAELTDAAEGTTAALLDRIAAPVRLHRIAAEQRRLQALYGADVPTAVLVRPDGHIAYRGDAADVVALKRYLDGVFVERRAPRAVTTAAVASPAREAPAVG